MIRRPSPRTKRSLLYLSIAVRVLGCGARPVLAPTQERTVVRTIDSMVARTALAIPNDTRVVVAPAAIWLDRTQYSSHVLTSLVAASFANLPDFRTRTIMLADVLRLWGEELGVFFDDRQEQLRFLNGQLAVKLVVVCGCDTCVLTLHAMYVSTGEELVSTTDFVPRSLGLDAFILNGAIPAETSPRICPSRPSRR